MKLTQNIIGSSDSLDYLDYLVECGEIVTEFIKNNKKLQEISLADLRKKISAAVKAVDGQDFVFRLRSAKNEPTHTEIVYEAEKEFSIFNIFKIENFNCIFIAEEGNKKKVTLKIFVRVV